MIFITPVEKEWFNEGIEEGIEKGKNQLIERRYNIIQKDHPELSYEEIMNQIRNELGLNE